MLSTTTVTKATELVDILRYQNARVSPKGGTPLSELVNTLASLHEDGSVDTIVSQSVTAGKSIGTHDEVEDVTIKKISRVMSNMISVAKNRVNPICRSIIAQIDQRRELDALNRVNLGGDILPVELPDVFKDNLFLNLIAPYEGVRLAIDYAVQRPLWADIEDLTLEELKDLCQTGNENLDKKIQKYCESINWSRMVDLVRYQVTNPIAECTGIEKLAWFFILQSIQNEKTDKCSYINGRDRNKVSVAEIRARIGYEFNREIKQYYRAVQSNQLIASGTIFASCFNTKSLCVYGEVYRKWIQKGEGSVEAALGYLAANGPTYSVAGNYSLITDAEKWANEYKLRINHLSNKSILDEVEYVRKTAEEALTAHINASESPDKAKLHARLDEALKREYHGAGNLHHYLIKVVCRTLTDGSTIKNYLLEVDSLLGQPNMTKENAMSIARMRMLAKWVTDQFQVQTQGI